MSDPTLSLHTYLTTALTSGFVGRPVEMVDHWQGHDNLLWRVEAGGQETVVKLFMDAGQARSRRQYDGQQLFAPLGLAPVPLWYDRYPEGLSRQVLVYRWVDGAPVEAQDTRALALLAQTAAQVHSYPADEVQRFSPRPFNLAYFWRVLAGGCVPLQGWLASRAAPTLTRCFALLVDQARGVVEAALPAAQHAPPSLVHGDLKLENCVSAWGSIVLVDWEMFGLGDPALEAANLLHVSRGDLAPSSGEEWLEHYLDAIGQPAIRARIGVYRQLLPLQDLCFLLAGVRDLTSIDRSDATFSATAGFLEQTLVAGIAAASAALGTALPGDVEHLATEVHGLVSGEDETFAGRSI